MFCNHSKIERVPIDQNRNSGKCGPMDPLFDLNTLPKRSRPKRKAVKKHVADILEKMFKVGDTQAVNINQIREQAQQKATEIDQVCYFQYGEDGEAYQRCVSNKLEENAETISMHSEEQVSATQQLMIEMIMRLPSFKDLLENDKFWIDHPEIHKNDLQWLVTFIEMVNKRPSYDGIEQNISITYFSSFVPITAKLDKIQKEEMPCIQEPQDTIHFYGDPTSFPIEDEWMYFQ